MHRLYGGLKDVLLFFVKLAYQVYGHFCVGLAFKDHAFGLKLCLELGVVFYDSVVNDGNRSVFACVRVGVYVAGLSVGGPASVADSNRAFNRFARDALFQFFERALGLADQNVLAVKNGDSSRVVASVFQFFK